MEKLISIILCINLIIGSSFSYAKCAKEVSLVEKDEAAPCRGYLFSPEKELEVRLLNEDYKLLKESYDRKDKQVEALKKDVIEAEAISIKNLEKSELWREKAEDSTQKYIASESGRGNRDLLFLGLGILTAVFAGWAVGQVAK